MLSPYIHAALAHERHQGFLARAETDRRARQARLHRLQDGTGAARRSPRRWRPTWLRPGPSLLFGHWPRFLTPKQELSPAELPYPTDVDHHDHETVGALNHLGRRGIGIARYIRDADGPQGRGLGTELVAQLCQ
jgi:hypothetical protein